eukprot:scaffold260436_cov51-Attheya_sp.AAC.1
MLQILKLSSHRILVCAETNLAVDNMALRFLQESKVNYGAIRVGGTGKRDGALESISLETLVRNQVTSRNTTQMFFLSRHKKIIRDLFNRSRIVFTTCAGSGDPVLDTEQFESVLMDEASMTTEPGALCPLAHGCRNFVLIGDHKQLGPQANSGTCVSLFERLTNPNSCLEATPSVTFLNEQHRMHPGLCRFPSRTFYGGDLVTATGVLEARPIPKCVFSAKSPIRFINVVNGYEDRLGSGSWFNEVEIKCVLEVLRELLKSEKKEISAAQITVLTPYRAQQMKIRESLSSWRDPPEVSSIDGFQGRENDVIVVSTVRCGFSLGFCDDEKRVNVLLTRAKRGLVVLGHRSTLERSLVWSKWLQEAVPK